MARQGHADSQQRRDSWLAWHIAALGRTKKMPKLDQMMPKGRTPASLSERLTAAFALHNQSIH